MANIYESVETTRIIDEDGNENISTVEKTSKVRASTEPDYIKIYLNMWCDLYQIPSTFRDLFMELATRMSYANLNDREGGQVVCTSGVNKDDICNKLGWKDAMYYRGLKSLTEFGAIRRISRGWYQINPEFAGKGEWKYNPTLQRGGIENIIGKFNIKSGHMETEVIWADDGKDTDFNKMYRDGIGVSKNDNAVLTATTITYDDALENVGV